MATLPVGWRLLILLGLAAFIGTLLFITWALEKTRKDDPGRRKEE